MKKLAFVITLASSTCLEAQINFEDHISLKSCLTRTTVQVINSKGVNKILIPNGIYPLVEIDSGRYKIRLTNGGSQFFYLDTTVAEKLSYLNKPAKKKKLNESLIDIQNQSKNLLQMRDQFSDILITADPENFIYENYYSGLRQEISKFWLEFKDLNIIKNWFVFLWDSKLGDDGLDAKYLAICFFSHPKEFSEILKAQKKEMSKFIIDLIRNSSGLKYAIDMMNLDYHKSIALFNKYFR